MSDDVIPTQLAARDVEHGFHSAVVEHRARDRHRACWLVRTGITGSMPGYIAEQRPGRRHPIKPIENS